MPGTPAPAAAAAGWPGAAPGPAPTSRAARPAIPARRRAPRTRTVRSFLSPPRMPHDNLLRVVQRGLRVVAARLREFLVPPPGGLERGFGHRHDLQRGDVGEAEAVDRRG